MAGKGEARLPDQCENVIHPVGDREAREMLF